MMRYSFKDTDFLVLKRAHDALAREWKVVKRELYARKFDPNQPRDDQGRWVDAGGGKPMDRPLNQTGRAHVAVMSSRPECERQWNSDIFQCKLVGVAACYSQAMVRLIACEKGHTIPELNY